MGSPLQRVLDRLPKARQYRQFWRTKCPLHDGKSRNSLSVHEKADGTVLMHCWGGCDTAAIVRHIGLQMRDLFPEGDAPNTGSGKGSKPAKPQRTFSQATNTAIPTFPTATDSTIYAALYVVAILADELPAIDLDEKMGCYLQICENLGRVYVDHGHAAALDTWKTWQPELKHKALALLAMISRTKGVW